MVSWICLPTGLPLHTYLGRIASEYKFVMRADAQNVIPPSNPRGRSSVRISSNKAWDESIIILDLQHMPEGCTTWPAFWSLSHQGPWPHGGEIDIIEGTIGFGHDSGDRCG